MFRFANSAPSRTTICQAEALKCWRSSGTSTENSRTRVFILHVFRSSVASCSALYLTLCGYCVQNMQDNQAMEDPNLHLPSCRLHSQLFPAPHPPVGKGRSRLHRRATVLRASQINLQIHSTLLHHLQILVTFLRHQGSALQFTLLPKNLYQILPKKLLELQPRTIL